MSLLLGLTRFLLLIVGPRRRSAAQSDGGAVVTLEEGKVWTAQPRVGVSVRCERGVVWLTQTGDGRDVVLKAGDLFTCVRRGKLVAMALEKAVFQIQRATSPSRDDEDECE
jgi:hypothetical protein